MRRLFAAATAILLLGGCHARDGGTPRVKDAWVRLAAVAGRPAAGYFTLKGGAKDDRLIAIESAVVKRIELHESSMAGGMMTMKPIATVALPAGATVEFAPGGNHAMLFEIDPQITPGTAIPMRFRFASGAAFEAEAKTVAAGADDGMAGGMAGMQH
jgi:copper(I)-binding protein